MKFQPAVFFFGAVVVPYPLVFGLTGIVGFVPSPAALENQDFVSGLSQPASCDGSAEAAANYDDIERHACAPTFLM